MSCVVIGICIARFFLLAVRRPMIVAGGSDTVLVFLANSAGVLSRRA